MPLRGKGCARWKAFCIGVLSGIVEPIGAYLTILLTNFILPILPFILSFASGTMIYVTAEELIPEANDKGNTKYGIIGLAIGFSIMMILDVAFG